VKAPDGTLDAETPVGISRNLYVHQVGAEISPALPLFRNRQGIAPREMQNF